MESSLGIKEEVNQEQDLNCLGDKYDAIITGSDQIWNFKAIDFSTSYLGDFITNHDKTTLIAYACSMGPSP